MSVATRPLFTGSVPARTPGTWTPDGTPATIDSGGGYKSFPGVARLGSGRLLLVYRDGTNHLAGGKIVGRIGTLSGTSVSWGSAFDIYDPAVLDARCEDGVSVVDGRAVIALRHYDGTANDLPSVLVCDDRAAIMTSGSTWTGLAITFAEGANQNATQGRVIKVGSTYVLGMAAVSGSAFAIGVILNDSLVDWSAPTWVPVSGDYTEVGIDRLAGDVVGALLRREADDSTWQARLTVGTATWTSPVSAHDGYGYPAFRRLTDQADLTAYRDSPAGDTAWRQSSAWGTWGAETILDTTGPENMYASLVQLDSDHALCVYSVEVSSTDADLYSQVFTRTP